MSGHGLSEVEKSFEEARDQFIVKFLEVNTQDPADWKDLYEFCKKERDKHAEGSIRTFWEERYLAANIIYFKKNTLRS